MPRIAQLRSSYPVFAISVGSSLSGSFCLLPCSVHCQLSFGLIIVPTFFAVVGIIFVLKPLKRSFQSICVSSYKTALLLNPICFVMQTQLLYNFCNSKIAMNSTQLNLS